MDFLTAADILAVPAPGPDRRLRYGTARSQFVELRRPAATGPHPLVVLVHGGCWIERFAGLEYFGALAETLRQAGYATWNLEYRRADEAGGGWPGTFRDVAAGIDLLRTVAGTEGIDPARVIACGHSAGAHLALWAAARARIPPGSELADPHPLPVCGVVAIAGPGDLEAARPHMSGPCAGDRIAQLMGGTESRIPQRYAIGSPIRLLPFGVRQILLSGRYDAIVPPRFADAYVRAATAAGDPAEHRIVEDAAHHEFGDPGSVAWPAVKKAIDDLSSPTGPPPGAGPLSRTAGA